MLHDIKVRYSYEIRNWRRESTIQCRDRFGLAIVVRDLAESDYDDAGFWTFPTKFI
jgi:hypothetical protein